MHPPVVGHGPSSIVYKSSKLDTSKCNSHLKLNPHNQYTHIQPEIMQNEKGQGVSHAKDSQVPGKIQEKAPAGLEHELPDSVHDTGSNKQTGKVSHAVGDSKVPQALQEALPEKVERAVPNAIHDTGPKK
ncbi:Hypothetical protein D9617_1g082780 [Elsinoe fawcettii]|nr:Hypothetical protein D9617_1g082780 [Elsinoe fawcettii]